MRSCLATGHGMSVHRTLLIEAGITTGPHQDSSTGLLDIIEAAAVNMVVVGMPTSSRGSLPQSMLTLLKRCKAAVLVHQANAPQPIHRLF